MVHRYRGRLESGPDARQNQEGLLHGKDGVVVRHEGGECWRV